MKNFKRRPILIIPLLQEAYSGRKGVGFESQGAGASTYPSYYCGSIDFHEKITHENLTNRLTVTPGRHGA